MLKTYQVVFDVEVLAENDAQALQNARREIASPIQPHLASKVALIRDDDATNGQDFGSRLSNGLVVIDRAKRERLAEIMTDLSDPALSAQARNELVVASLRLLEPAR
jgi:hypothetical protein